jgi:hypothetical protein
LRPGRTALVVVLDEAERVVEDFQERFDPAAERMIPAHVTVVFPFADTDTADVAAVRDVYSGEAPFDYDLARIERFPEHVWLAPEPKNRFVELVARTIDRFPDYPPYGGIFDEVIPHRHELMSFRLGRS